MTGPKIWTHSKNNFEHSLLNLGVKCITVCRRTKSVSVAAKALNRPHTNTKTHNRRTIYHCIGYWQAYLDYISSIIPKIHLLTREDQKHSTKTEWERTGDWTVQKEAQLDSMGGGKQERSTRVTNNTSQMELKYNKTIPQPLIRQCYQLWGSRSFFFFFLRWTPPFI